jgi:hypothetical protein
MLILLLTEKQISVILYPSTKAKRPTPKEETNMTTVELTTTVRSLKEL